MGTHDSYPSFLPNQLLTSNSSLTGLTFTVPDAELQVIQVDGGNPVASSHAAHSVGILYPGERVDMISTWPESAVAADAEIVIRIDHE